jgi:hypothetical protein
MRKFLNNPKNLKQLCLKYCLKFLTVGFLGGSIIAIICANQADPSWVNYNTVNSLVANPLGWLGANLAATYFYLLGLVAYFSAIFGAYLLWLNLAPKIKIQDEWERVLGFMGVLSSLLLIFKQGVLGRVIYLKLNLLCDSLVILLIGVIIFFAALTLILRFSVLLFLYHKITDLRAQVYYRKFISGGASFALNSLKAGFNLIKSLGNWFYSTIFGGSENPELAATLFKAKYHDGARLDSDDQALNSQNLNSPDLSSNNSNNFNFLNNLGLNRNSTNNTDVTNINSANSGHDNPVSFNHNSNNLGQAYKLPDLNIFTAMQEIYTQDEQVTKVLQKQAKTLAEKLKCFGVFGQVVSVEYGPVVSLFEFKPHIESKVSKIMALEHDLALALETTSLRIIAPVPGKSVVGFEVANRERRAVFFGDLIAAPEFEAGKYELPLILGQDTIGKNVTIDLVKMPHLLIAGSTGAGKSVALNTMLTSLLCCCTPQNLKLILVDPKRLEFAGYEDIPHLLFPIATESREVINILKWVVQEMEQRYLLMSETEVKNIAEYHVYCEKNSMAHLPYIVIVIDELADLMMTAGKEVENLIIRIAQKARAAGIHLIVATQRPSVDVITGLIKINFPSRISFRVASKVDSRTVLDCMGAEKLLGRGDMLFLDSQSIGLRRVHGAYVSNDEVKQVVQHLLGEGKAQYLDLTQELKRELGSNDTDGDESLLPEVLTFLRTTNEISISLLQRRFRIGYNRSARIIDTLESLGYVLQAEGGKMRRVNKSVLQ